MCSTLEEASRLPPLLVDLQQWPGDLDVIVSDGSRDQTRVAQLAGASVLDNPQAGRGLQLRWGVDHSSHARVQATDSRLPGGWHQKVARVLNRPEAHLSAWFFNFNVDAEGRPCCGC